jgi:farnesyl-diphosphate farnesyltransferase
MGRMALNHMCLNALQHVGDVLTYLSLLHEPSVFLFCAIPQVMAIATLSEIFNNPLIFQGNVKIRKGLAVYLIQNASTMNATYSIFNEFLHTIRDKSVQALNEVVQFSDSSKSESAELLQFDVAEMHLRIIRLCTSLIRRCRENSELHALEPTAKPSPGNSVAPFLKLATPAIAISYVVWQIVKR